MTRRFPGTFAALSALFLAVLFLAFGGEGNKAYAQTTAGSLGAPEALSARAIATSTPAAIEFSAAGSDGTLTGSAIENRQPVVGGFNRTGDANAVQIAAAAPACPLKVLIVYADSFGGSPTALQSQILAEPGVISADLFDASQTSGGTPTLAQLQAYDVVAPFSNNKFLDSVTLGNNLADYVDAGGIVVQVGFSFYGPGEEYGINGRWLSGNYNPYDYSTNLLLGDSFTLGTFNAGHPLMAGVTTLNSNFANIVALAAGATEVAAASNGNSLVAYRPVSGGHTTVGITAYVGAAATQSGHWGRVVVNAGRWLSAHCQSGAVLSSLSPANVWVGLANSDDVGIRFDLLANVSVNGVPVGSGHLDSVAGGSSGFNNAKLNSILLTLTAPVTVSSGDVFSIQVAARNACAGSGKNSGRARLWYNGQPIDTGATRDAGSRFDATIGGTNSDYFLRPSSVLSRTAGSAKVSTDVAAGAKCGPFVSFGTWNITLP
jgi:hypothetical protein